MVLMAVVPPELIYIPPAVFLFTVVASIEIPPTPSAFPLIIVNPSIVNSLPEEGDGETRMTW